MISVSDTAGAYSPAPCYFSCWVGSCSPGCTPQFFPKDLSYLSYVDVWLPPDAPLGATDAAAKRAETVIREEAERFGKEHNRKDVLKSVTTFDGGGGPRFWFSVDPEQQQLNYAQLIVEVSDKHLTNELVGPLQTALSRDVPGARVDVRQLETGKPVGIPISVRISGADEKVLHQLSSEMQAMLPLPAKRGPRTR